MTNDGGRAGRGRKRSAGAAWTGPLLGVCIAVMAWLACSAPALGTGSLAVTPDGGAVYAVAGTGIYTSWDAGGNWYRAAGVSADLAQEQPWTSIVVAPSDPRRVYVGSAQGIFRTADGGLTWSDAAGPIDTQGLLGAAAPALAVDRNDPDRVVLGTPCAGAFDTRDGGATWGQSLAGIPVSLNCPGVFSVLADASRPSTVFAGVYDIAKPLAVLDPAARTWHSATSPDAGQSTGFLADPETPGRLYALSFADSRVFGSTDGARTWSTVGTTGAPGAEVLAWVAVPGSSGHLILAKSDGVYGSSDGGQTWARRSRLQAHEIAAGPGGLVYALTETGIARSQDGGVTWKEVLVHEVFRSRLAPKGSCARGACTLTIGTITSRPGERVVVECRRGCIGPPRSVTRVPPSGRVAPGARQYRLTRGGVVDVQIGASGFYGYYTRFFAVGSGPTVLKRLTCSSESREGCVHAQVFFNNAVCTTQAGSVDCRFPRGITVEVTPGSIVTLRCRVGCSYKRTRTTSARDPRRTTAVTFAGIPALDRGDRVEVVTHYRNGSSAYDFRRIVSTISVVPGRGIALSACGFIPESYDDGARGGYPACPRPRTSRP